MALFARVLEISAGSRSVQQLLLASVSAAVAAVLLVASIFHTPSISLRQPGRFRSRRAGPVISGLKVIKFKLHVFRSKDFVIDSVKFIPSINKYKL